MAKNINDTLQAQFPHLEIAILPLSQVKQNNQYFRIDSEPFKKNNLTINKSIKYERLSEIAIINPSKAEIQNFNENLEITFLSMQNVGNGFINEREIGTIKDFKNGYTYFAENDILIAKITPCMEHGKCAIATNLNNSIGFGSTEFNVFRIKDSRFLQEFIFCYLNRENIRKIASDNMIGTSGRQRVPTEFYENLLIPILPESFQQEIQNLVKDSHKALEQSKALYKDAQNELLNALDFTHIEASAKILNDKISEQNIEAKFPHLNLSIRALSQSYGKSGRLDSEYYQRKYDSIENAIKSYKGGYCRLKDIGIFTNGSFIPESFYTQNAQRAYIRIKELSFDSPIKIQDCIYIADTFEATNETIVKQNDCIIATIGTIGKVNLIPKELEGSFISNNTSKFSITDKGIIPQFLEILLRSFIVQEQIQKEFTQTIQPKISNTSLENILIPKISQRVQENIADKITQSFALRKQSKDLLESAKAKVESAVINS